MRLTLATGTRRVLACGKDGLPGKTFHGYGNPYYEMSYRMRLAFRYPVEIKERQML